MKKNKIISALVIILFIVFIIVISPRTMQNDTFWSIKVGEKIVKEGIFGLDTFSIHEGLYYIAHHFLTDVLIYFVYCLGGFQALYILEVILALILAGVLYLLNKEINNNKFVALIMLFIQMAIMSSFIAVRAQMISFILFGIEMLLLEKFMKSNKNTYIVGLSIIPIVLANFHMGTVPFYFVILGVYFISLIKLNIPFMQSIEKTDKARLKQLFFVGLIGLVTIFVNPYFIDGVIYPFKTFGNEFINSTIQEFSALSIASADGWYLVYIAIIMGVLLFRKTKLLTRDFLLLFGTLFMAFTAIRYVSIFVICSAVALRYVVHIVTDINLKSEDIKSIKGTLVILMLLMTLTLLAGYMTNKEKPYIPDTLYPVQALEFVKEGITEDARIFNYYNWGSYLMLNNIKVYVDSRIDLYTKEYSGTDIADDYNKLMKCDKDYMEIIEKYDLNTFIIPADSSLATLLEENVEFKKVYGDEVAVIYVSK